MKLTVSKSKNSASFYVQRTVRKPNGSITTETVEKLGNLTEVTAKAGGKDPYKWAQEYVNELNRHEYEESKEIIVSYSQSKLLNKGKQQCFNCGYLFLQHIYYELGLNRICKEISKRHSFEYDLNDVLSRLIYTRIIYPSSKLSSYKQSKKFIEQPTFELHDIYRALSVLAEENDFIQAQLYKNSEKVLDRKKEVLYYDCTNFFFELEEEDELRRYGKGKQHQPLPLVGMGLFMDYDGIPLAFDIYPGNKNEQPTLKPLEQKVINDFGLEQVIVCTDAGLSSTANRKFNNRTVNGVQTRSFITTQSVKQLPAYLKDFALDPDGWHLAGSKETFNITELDSEDDCDKVFYKDRWVVEDVSQKKIE
jgi:transposase